MINFPKLSNQSGKTQKMTYSFGGINRGEGYNFGELETSENISLLSHPAIGGAPEKKAASLYVQAPDDVIFSGGIFMIKDNSLRYSGEKRPTSCEAMRDLSAGEKECVKMGKYLVVYPDKLWHDTEETSWQNIGETFAIAASQTTYHSNAIEFKNYSDYSSFASKFFEGDTIEIDGGFYVNDVAKTANAKATIRTMTGGTRTVTFDPNTFDIPSSGEVGIATTFKRNAPELKFILSHGGRLWGVEKNEIKASKFQSPYNFEYFDLSAADSYAVETAEPGDFTASFSMGDYALFFKENLIYRITGTKPSNFRLTVIPSKGVKSGCQRSLAQQNGTVYYVGTDGVYACGGAESKKISAAIGNLSDVTSASGGFLGSVYYVSLKRAGGIYETYGYDTEKRMWFKAGSDGITSMGALNGELWCLKTDKTLFKLTAGGEREKDFSVTLREYDEGKYSQKGFSRLYLKYKLNDGGYIRVETSLDFAPFKEAAIFSDSKRRVSEIRLSPNRGDNMRLKISVYGGGLIEGMMREYFSHGSLF